MAGIKKQSFLKGTAVLVAANFLVKLIGAVFKIPLAHVLEEEGMALFSSAYNFYAILFVIATSGLPVAVSKMVSESAARGNEAEAKKIFRTALLLLTAIGLSGACALLFCARHLAKCVGSENSALGILCVSPSVFFVAVLSAFRGYFQGRSNMTPTALSEVAEALGKLLVGLSLAALLRPAGLVSSSAGAVLGVTAGSLLGCLTVGILYAVDARHTRRATLPAALPVRPARRILAELAAIAVPITLGAAVSSLTNLIDLFMIRQRLCTLTVTPDLLASLRSFYGLTAAEATSGTNLSGKAAEIFYGAYSGYAVPMFNLPLTIVTALSMCLIPAISGAFTKKNLSRVRSLTEISVRLTLLFALPCAVGLALLAGPILAVLYNNVRAQSVLSVLAWAVVPVCLVTVTTSILQASGHVMLPVVHMAIGAAVKIFSGFFLLAVPQLNIGGAPLSTVACYCSIAVLNLSAIRRILRPDFRIGTALFKGAAAALAMAAAAYAVYRLASVQLGAPLLPPTICFLPRQAAVTPFSAATRMKIAIALSAAIFAGGALYFLFLLPLRAFSREEWRTITKRNETKNRVKVG